MSRLRATLAWFAFVAACVVALVAGSLFVLEQTGTLARFLREQIAAELGPDGDALTIGHATLSWFDPGLHLEDVRFAGDEGFVQIDRLDVLLRGALNPLSAIQSVRIAGGQVLYSPDLGERLVRLGGGGETSEAPSERPELPRLRIRDLEFALATPKAGQVPLGSLELIVEMDAERLLRASGVLRPPGAREGSAAMHVSGLERPRNRFQLRAGSLGLPLERLAIGAPRAANGDSALPRVAGTVRIAADATLHLDGGERNEAHARVSWVDGSVEPGLGIAPITGAHAELSLDYAADGDRPYWHLPAWDLVARIDGDWNESHAETWILAGKSAPEDAGGGIELRTRIDDLQLEGADLQKIVERVGATEDVTALGPGGRVDLAFATRLDWTGSTLDLAPEVLLHARPDGDASITYFGWPSSWTREIEGIPLPAERLTGHAVFAVRDRLPDWHAGLLVTGDVGVGRVEGRGTLSPPSRTGRPIDLDLDLSLKDAAIDEALRRGLDGMASTRDIWTEYGPRSGEVSSRWRLLRDPSTEGLFAEGRVDVRNGRALWSELPVPVEDVAGTLRFHWADRGVPVLTPLGEPSENRAFGVSFDFEGRSRTVGAIRIEGRSRQEFSVSSPAPPPAEAPRVGQVRLEVDGLPLRGSDWDLLAAALPDVAAEVAQLQPRGKVDAVYESSQDGRSASRELAIEVQPTELVLQPAAFPMRTEDVRGRFSVRAGEDAEGQPVEAVIQATIAGRWGGGAFVAASGGTPRRGRSELLVYGAGVDPSNPAVRGSLSDALAKASGERVDISALGVEGRIDVRADVPLEGEAEMRGGTLRIYLRDNRLSMNNFGLSGLRGVLTLEDEILRGERVQARLGSTPVELRDAAFLSSDAVDSFVGADPLLAEPGLVPPERVSILQADLHARDLPLDREHIQGFLDEDSLRALLDSAGLVGLVDLLGTRVLLVGDGAAGAKVVVRGDLVPHGVSLDPGLPVQISSARVRVNRMLYEAGRLRAWADISDVYARLAERELSGARFVAGYAEGRLTVQDLDGTFEGGRLRSLGGTGQSSAAMHADLAEPFRFDLSVELENVDVDGVLEGVFPSNVRDTGRLNAQLRLAGSLEDPLGLVGDGAGWISNARLWSIPVVRELFSRLGFDGTAVFDRMSFRFRLRDGVVRFPDVRARSPLLQLVGQDGKVDLDGRLSFDLEVRYSLIDNLGPVNRLVYWIQNNLLRVSIRGNMARPRVLLRNVLNELFGGPDLQRQDLPLPELSPVPERF